MDNKEIVNKYLTGDFEIENNFELDEMPIIIDEELTEMEIINKYFDNKYEKTIKKSQPIKEEKIIEEDLKEDNKKIVLKGKKIIKVKPINTVEKDEKPNFKKPTIHHLSMENDDEIKDKDKMNENKNYIDDSNLDEIKIENIDNNDKEELNPIIIDEKVDLPNPADLNDVFSNVIVQETVNTEVKPVGTVEPTVVSAAIPVPEEVKIDEMVVENNPNNNKKPKKENKILRVIISILIFLFVMASIAVGVLYIFNANYKTLVSKSFNYFKNYYNFSSNDINLKNFELDGDLKLKYNDPSAKKLVVFDNEYNYNFKKYNENIQLDFDIERDNKKLLETSTVFNDNKLYLFAKDIYNKYILMGDLKSENKNISYEKLLLTFEKSLVLFVDNINKDSYKSETTKIKLNNKEQKVRATRLTITEKDLYYNLKKVLETLKKDKEVKDVAALLYENYIVENTEFGDTKIVYSIYTKGIMHDIVGIDYEVKSKVADHEAWYASDCYGEEDCLDEIPEKDKIYKIEFRNENKQAINIYQDNELLQSFLISKKGNILQIEFNDQVKSVGTIIITKNDLSTKISLDSSIDDVTLSLIIENNVKKISNKEYDIDLIIKSKIKEESEYSLGIEAVSKMKLKEITEEIKKPTDVVNMDEMSGHDLQIIEDKLMIKLYDIIGLQDMLQNDDDYYLE